MDKGATARKTPEELQKDKNHCNVLSHSLQSWALQVLPKSQIMQSLQKYFATIAENICNPFHKALPNSPKPRSGMSLPAGCGTIWQ
jgi:hypothetical protein